MSRLVNSAIRFLQVLGLGSLALSTGCSTVDIHTQAMPILASVQLRTYAWDPAMGSIDELDLELRAAIEENMSRLGLMPMRVDHADFLVSCNVVVELRSQVGAGGPEEVEVGTLELVLKERRSGELLWRGKGTSTAPAGFRLDPPGGARGWDVRRKLSAMFDRLRRDLGLDPWPTSDFEELS